MTPDQLIEKYIALRNKKQAMEAEHEEALKPYKHGMEKIEQVMLGMLNDLHTDSMSARGIGTCYRKTLMTAKVDDRQALLQELVSRIVDVFNDNPHMADLGEGMRLLTPVFDPFTNAVSKEWVKDYLDEHKAVPPGVAVDHFVSVGFRKA